MTSSTDSSVYFSMISEAISWAFGINADVYRAIGRPDVFAKIEFVLLLMIIPTYLIAVQSGLVIFLYARVGVTVVGLLFHIYVFQRVLNLSVFYLWHQGKEAILAVASMGALLWIMKSMHQVSVMHNALKITLFIVTGSCVYMAVIWLLDRHFILKTVQLLKRASA